MRPRTDRELFYWWGWRAGFPAAVVAVMATVGFVAVWPDPPDGAVAAFTVVLLVLLFGLLAVSDVPRPNGWLLISDVRSIRSAD